MSGLFVEMEEPTGVLGKILVGVAGDRGGVGELEKFVNRILTRLCILVRLSSTGD